MIDLAQAGVIALLLGMLLTWLWMVGVWGNDE